MPRVTRRALSTLTALVMVGTLFVGAPAPVRATADDIYIGYAADTSSADCTDPDFTADGGDDSAQIALAVDDTNAGGTLHFCPGTYDIDTTIDLSGTDITLRGAAAATTILDGNDGGGATQILYSSGAITVSDLTFQDGSSDGDYGGAIFASTATVTDSTFTNNTATVAGGAIVATTVTVTDSTFTNNTANYGGAIYTSTATVTDSTFTNNDAVAGGAIYAYTTATVTDSTFTNNDAVAGGAIVATTATVSNSTFTDNTATTNGGAIYAYTTATVTDSTFTDNDAAYYGGAIYTATTAVTRSTFTNNVAGGYGGAIYAGGTATVTSSTFTGNIAVYGGAIEASTGTITRSRFTRNTAGEHGGAMLLYAPNSADLRQLRGNTFMRNTAPAGGAITLGQCVAPSRSEAARVLGANRFSGNRATEQRRTNNVERWEEDGVC